MLSVMRGEISFLCREDLVSKLYASSNDVIESTRPLVGRKSYDCVLDPADTKDVSNMRYRKYSNNGSLIVYEDTKDRIFYTLSIESNAIHCYVSLPMGMDRTKLDEDILDLADVIHYNHNKKARIFWIGPSTRCVCKMMVLGFVAVLLVVMGYRALNPKE